MSTDGTRRFGIYAMMAVLAAAAIVYVACLRITLDVFVSTADGQVTFNVPHRNINGILMLRVTDDTEVLWEVLTSYDLGHAFVYGKLPSGGNMPARQTVPEAGRNAPDIRGRKVTIEIEYQYDRGFSPLTARFKKVIDVP